MIKRRKKQIFSTVKFKNLLSERQHEIEKTSIEEFLLFDKQKKPDFLPPKVIGSKDA